MFLVVTRIAGWKNAKTTCMKASPYSGDDVIPPDAIKIASATVSIELASIEIIIALRRCTENR